MDTFETTFAEKSTELLNNLKNFTEKGNNAAGSRTRKNAQELKKLLQELRVEVLDQQKQNKEEKAKAKANPEKVAVSN